MKPPNPHTSENTARRNFYKCRGGDLHRMKLYLNEMRDSISAKRNFIANSHKEELKLWPNMAQMIDEVYEGKYQDYDINFKGTLLNSSLVASFSIFETVFKNVINHANYIFNKKIGIGNIRGDIVGEFKKIIENQFGIKLTEVEQYWQIIDRAKKIRNRITHHAGSFRPITEQTSSEQKELIKFVRTSGLFHIRRPRSKRGTTFLIKDQDLINEFLDTSGDYLIWILMQMPKTKRRVPKSKTKD